jgi:citrate/tricarballylate utilization protein
MLATEAQREGERQMAICNACRYCEGLCAVFPAMEMRQSFAAGDLNYLANLCHGCGACYYDCQFAPPHEFAIDVPRTMAQLRVESYEAYAWPRALAPLFRRNGLAVASIAAASVAAFILGFAATIDPAALFAAHSGPGSFYKLMPHGAMAGLFGAVFLFALFAMGMGVRNFLRDIGETASGIATPAPLAQAVRDAGTLRYLDGGGPGCMNESERPDDNRRIYHHLTFYGFMLCLASTSVATVYHYALGRIAPYPWWDLPVVLGTIGGIGLILGPLGLLRAKRRRDTQTRGFAHHGMDTAFLVMLLLTSVTGLALLVLRETAAMGTLLALHLGVVFALFLTMPYGKFVHGLYRFAALARYARERRTHGAG